MSILRRYNQTGLTYFITTVTKGRRPILTSDINLYRRAIEIASRRFSTDVIAWAVLPEHLHLVQHSESVDVSVFMKGLKFGYGLLYRQRFGKNCGAVWQLRFWDHIIRDQEDLNRHIDYVHINPVKHGLCARPIDYPCTSFAEFVKAGYYTENWGVREAGQLEGDFGE